jgi:hypothetical protein
MGLASLWTGIKERFRRTPVKPAGGPALAPRPGSGKAQPPQTGFLDPDSFARALLKSSPQDKADDRRVQVFSLSDFRQAVGGKWDRLSGLLEVAGDAIIRRHVDLSKDVITRLDAEIACLSMPVASRQESRARVASIAADLASYLFGDALIDGRRPQVVAANMAVKDAVTEDGTLDHEAIRKAVAQAGAALPARAGLSAPHRATLAAMMAPAGAAQAEGKPAKDAVYAVSGGDAPYRIDEASVPKWVMEEPRTKDVQILKVEGQTLNGADAPRQVMRVEGATLNGADAPRQVMTVAAHDGKGADWLEEQLELQAEAGLNSEHRLSPESSLTLVWTPTWVATKRAVGAFHAKVIRVDREGAPSLEGAYAYAEAAPIESLTMDRFVATQAAFELKDLFFGRHKLGLTVPFHWMSLAPRWRDCIRIPFESCPPQARRKHLKIEIFGLTPAIPPHVIARLFQPLEMLDCTLMARLPLSAPGMVKALKGVKAIGIDLAQLTPQEKTGDAELLERMERFRDMAHKSGMACYVWGIRRRPLIAEVIKAGFSLVNGPGVMTDLAHPRPASGG